MEPDIIYEDKNFLIINKPAGLVIHPDEHHKTGTLVQFVADKYPEIKNVGSPPADRQAINERPGLVHRLDKDTSGILIIARNQKSFDYLKSLFKNKEIKKTYLLLVGGNVKKDAGVIDLPIGRSRKDSRRRVAREKQEGKTREAITEFKVLKRFEGYTFLQANPKTGRTHQIRAHFAALGHPVACDKIYSGKRLACPAGLDRQFLHAWKLEFISPTGAKMLFEADLPDDLERVLSALE